MLSSSQPMPDTWASSSSCTGSKSNCLVTSSSCRLVSTSSVEAATSLFPGAHVGAVGCWCLCARQLALAVIRLSCPPPPTPRPTTTTTPPPDDSVSNPTRHNPLLITSSEMENKNVLSSGSGVGFLRKTRYYLSQYWPPHIIQPHTQRHIGVDNGSFGGGS